MLFQYSEMDLPCVQWQDRVAQKWKALDEDIKKQFICQLTPDALFESARTLTTWVANLFFEQCSISNVGTCVVVSVFSDWSNKSHSVSLQFCMSPSLSFFNRQEDLNYLQRIAADFSVQKDAERANRCRERGNTCFKTRDYTAAARHYSMVCSCILPHKYGSQKTCWHHNFLRIQIQNVMGGQIIVLWSYL